MKDHIRILKKIICEELAGEEISDVAGDDGDTVLEKLSKLLMVYEVGLINSPLPRAPWKNKINGYLGWIESDDILHMATAMGRTGIEAGEHELRSVLDFLSEIFEDKFTFTIKKWGGTVPDGIPDPKTHIDYVIHKDLSIYEKKAAKTTGKPYKGSRRGKTESQAQQMAAGIALSARRKHGKKGAIEKLKGAPKSMASMSMKDLKKLATIRRGSEVPDSTKKGHERAALPGHIKKKKK